MNSALNILVIDCFDSFTFNLVHYIEPLVNNVYVVRVNKIENKLILKSNAIVLSPGPGIPSDYPMLKDIILKSGKPILGVCLGLQAMVEAFGGKLMNLPYVWHGIARETIVDNNEPLFKNLPNKIYTGRYHSWIAKNIPECFKVTAIDYEGFVMAISHKTFPLKAVQFHPESILTQYGKQIIKNWVENIYNFFDYL